MNPNLASFLIWCGKESESTDLDWRILNTKYYIRLDIDQYQLFNRLVDEWIERLLLKQINGKLEFDFQSGQTKDYKN